MEGIFKAIPKDKKLVFFNTYDFERYLMQEEGVELIVHIKELSKTSEKMRLYAYYHAVVLECFILGATRAGNSGIDKVTADYMIRAEFAKDFVKGIDGEYKPIILDKSRMNMKRLHKLVQDAIHYIESNLEMEVPNSEEYKLNKLTGKNFKEVK